MDIPRSEAELLQLIRDQVEESVNLDYKRADALTNRKADLTKEVTKDVSAFANSAGGVLVYGIAEGSGPSKHLPEALSPLDRTEFSKERLEHLINNVQPRILGIEIVPISLSSGPNHTAYVVVVPASTTAHQCTDKCYYRRFNFESVPMEDYEIRDVMNRRSLPKIEFEATISFSVEKFGSPLGMPALGSSQSRVAIRNTLSFSATNVGGVTAKHVLVFVELPPNLTSEHDSGGRFQLRNFLKQKTGWNPLGFAQYGDPQWIPILPSLSLELAEYSLPVQVIPSELPDFSIPWVAHCDDAPARGGLFTKQNVLIEVSDEYVELLESWRKK